MTRRRDCTCAGTAPGYPQHEWWCGKPEPADDPLHPLHRADEPVDDRLVVELHSVATIGVPEQKPSLSDCLKANGVPREQWATVSAAVAVWMRAWFHDVLNDDEPSDGPDGAAGETRRVRLHHPRQRSELPHLRPQLAATRPDSHRRTQTARPQPRPRRRGMTVPLRITVHGRPAPQGSKRHVGRGILIESSKGLQPWRQAVTTAAHHTRQRHEHPGYPTGPLTVAITYLLPRPTSLPKHKPALPWRRPDLDKYIRATFDALTDAGIWHDDAQVTTLHARKIYAQPGQPIGARITIQTADVDELAEALARHPANTPP